MRCTRVFNMGMGFVIMVDEDEVDTMVAAAPEARVIGRVIERTAGPRVVMA